MAKYVLRSKYHNTQNDWSPTGPENNPIVVVSPKVKNKFQPFCENKLK